MCASRDWITWDGSSDGVYTSRLASHLFQNNNQGAFSRKWKLLIWIRKVPSKVELFVWLVCRGRVLVKLVVQKRVELQDDEVLCPFYRSAPESQTHSLDPPPVGFLKLNVDGAMSCDGYAGSVGGLLCDHNGKKLLQFAFAVGSGSSILAEILAVKTGMEVFIGLKWFKKSLLIIECDSKNVVDWFNDCSKAPDYFIHIMNNFVERM
ncbi:hypothetical protein V6N11_065211 [Hibiscus sabdariffa]|uniref:RNase H type-1 domain-containing protein n=2 Tax=Hibiscus sabdariffa TaxID=183260 RepID=A0ABR2QGJ8_9ROSI